VPGINHASFDLILRNAEHLINYIYQNKDSVPYNKPEVRVGLVIKILIKSDDISYSSDLLQPVINDLEQLFDDDEYINTFDDPVQKKRALSQELSLINRFIELDETMTLNSLNYLPVKGIL